MTMISNSVPMNAWFAVKNPIEDSNPFTWVHTPVLAWKENGAPLVFGDDRMVSVDQFQRDLGRDAAFDHIVPTGLTHTPAPEFLNHLLVGEIMALTKKHGMPWAKAVDQFLRYNAWWTRHGVTAECFGKYCEENNIMSRRERVGLV